MSATQRGADPTPHSLKPMARTFRIGLYIGPTDPFWVQVRAAIAQRVQHLPVDLLALDDIDLYLGVETAVSCPDRLAALAEELRSRQLDALIARGLPDALMKHLLEHDLAIISLSKTPLRHPRLVSPLGLYESGRIIGAHLAERLHEQGHVLIVGGLMAEPESGSNRLSGIRAALSPYAEITTEHLPIAWDYQQAVQLIVTALRHSRHLPAAIIGLNDPLALAACEAGQLLGLRPAHMLIGGINGDPLALAAIADGRMAATVDIVAGQFGVREADLALCAAQGLPLPAHSYPTPRLVTAENLTEVALQKLIAIAEIPNYLVGVNRQLEQEQLIQLETSLAINRRVGSILDRQQLAQVIAELIRANYGYDLVQLWLWSATEQALDREPCTLPRTSRTHLPLGEAGVLGEALVRDELVYIPDTHHSHRYPLDPDWPTTRARTVVPIHLGDQTLGLLDLHCYQRRQHSRVTLNGLQTLADQLGIAMHNANLYGEALAARAHAEKADQLKTRLLANVSHELRTPLNVILGFSQTALGALTSEQATVPVNVPHDLQQISRSGEHLLHLINDLLDLSRAEIGALELCPEAIAVHPFLADTFRSMVNGANEHDVLWLLAVPEHLPPIHADPVRLRQIVLNLLSNARKFTTRGTIVLGAALEPPHLHVWVSDTGAGIPIDLQACIFEPFVTGEETGHPSGIGLGLSITRHLVVLHHGSLTLESQPGHGSTFHVYLPLSAAGGHPVTFSPTAQPALLLLSAQDHPPTAITALSERQGLAIRHIRPGDNVPNLLMGVQPVAIAYDLPSNEPGEAMLLELLRVHPQLSQLPLLLYRHEHNEGRSLASSLTNVLLKPLSGNQIIEAITALHTRALSGPIMIVDDDPQARELYARLAASALPAHPILVADGGASALDMLGKHVPSLVILDIVMPDVNGFAVLEALRARPQTQHVPVVILSGYMLTGEDIKRLHHAHVTFHSKNLLSSDELMAALRHGLNHAEHLSPPTSAVVKQTIGYIHQHYPQDFSLQQIADAVNVNKYYLSRIFQQELGLSPWEYVQRYRIKHAKELLQSTNLSITVIATEVGFADVSYFGRVFRKIVGCSPSAFRQQAG